MVKAILLLSLAALGLAETPVSQFNQEKGVAVEGTDVVAYFTLGRPTPGKAEYSHEWKGARWQFSSEEHLKLFAANPEKYAPQYGGYCSYAMSHGKTSGITPKNWKIVDGKLYLNHRFVQGLWERKIPEHIENADRHWPGIAKLPAK